MGGMAFLVWLAGLPLRVVQGVVLGVWRVMRGVWRVMLSLAKLIVVVAVIGLVFGLVWLGRLGQGRSRGSGAGKTSHNKTRRHDASKQAVDLQQCPQCKAWVAGACESCGGE